MARKTLIQVTLKSPYVTNHITLVLLVFLVCVCLCVSRNTKVTKLDPNLQYYRRVGFLSNLANLQQKNWCLNSLCELLFFTLLCYTFLAPLADLAWKSTMMLGIALKNYT